MVQGLFNLINVLNGEEGEDLQHLISNVAPELCISLIIKSGALGITE